MTERPVRTRILDAATGVIATDGWSGLTMARLGAIAGVSRQTVYNELGSKPALAAALVAREFDRYLTAVDQELIGGDLVGDIGRAVRVVLEMGADDPLLVAVVSPASGAEQDVLPLLTTRSEPLVQAATDLLVTRIEDGYPAQAPAGRQLRVAADAVVRVVLSRIVQPADSPEITPDDLAWVAGRLLAEPF